MAHLTTRKLVNEGSHQFLINNGFHNICSVSHWCQYSNLFRIGSVVITLNFQLNEICDSYPALFQKIYDTGLFDGNNESKLKIKEKAKELCNKLIAEFFDEPTNNTPTIYN